MSSLILESKAAYDQKTAQRIHSTQNVFAAFSIRGIAVCAAILRFPRGKHSKLCNFPPYCYEDAKLLFSSRQALQIL